MAYLMSPAPMVGGNGGSGGASGSSPSIGVYSNIIPGNPVFSKEALEYVKGERIYYPKIDNGWSIFDYGFDSKMRKLIKFYK